jgi:peroxiredoxin Q/BCP
MLSKITSSQQVLSQNKDNILIDKAPDFSLLDQVGNRHSLEDYRGGWLVIYFYPKDDTPGCTTEACSIRDVRTELEEVGAKVVGISRDDQGSHQQFTEKYNLNFTILSDTNTEVTKKYGAWGQNQKGSDGVLRKTFIINPSGEIAKTYIDVIPEGHGEEIVVDLVELQNHS